MDALTKRRLMQAESEHDPEHDVPDGPPVTWVEMALINAVNDLIEKNDQLRERVAHLERERRIQ